MIVVAFLVIAFMIGGYVILDGFDLGVATIAPLIAKNDRERLAAMQAIGPFWNGNEVWLIAAGGLLFALFPKAYASSFSGFYLPFMVVLWLLMGRGMSLELREHYKSSLWHQFWDANFTLASTLLVLLFGIALGNLLRGVPLDRAGYFFGTFAFLLNWYALLVGVFAVVTLAMHGAAFIVLRLDGEPAARARVLLGRLWIAVAALLVAVSVATFAMRPDVVLSRPGVDVLGLAAVAALVTVLIAARKRAELVTFIASSAFIALLLAVAAATMYPEILRGFPNGQGSISIFDAAPSPSALASALIVGIIGMVVVLVYSTLVWQKMAGKVRVGE